MKFGTCAECNSYKYLEDGSKCPTCLNTGDEWVVLYVIPHGARGPEVYREDISEKKAKDIALGDPRLIPKHRSAYYGKDVYT